MKDYVVHENKNNNTMKTGGGSGGSASESGGTGNEEEVTEISNHEAAGKQRESDSTYSGGGDDAVIGVGDSHHQIYAQTPPLTLQNPDEISKSYHRRHGHGQQHHHVTMASDDEAVPTGNVASTAAVPGKDGADDDERGDTNVGRSNSSKASSQKYNAKKLGKMKAGSRVDGVDRVDSSHIYSSSSSSGDNSMPSISFGIIAPSSSSSTSMLASSSSKLMCNKNSIYAKERTHTDDANDLNEDFNINEDSENDGEENGPRDCVEVSEREINDANIDSITQAIRSVHTRKLDFRDNGIATESVLRLLVDAIRGNGENMESIYFGSNALGPECSEVFIQQLFAPVDDASSSGCVCALPNMTMLYLGNNDLGALGAQALSTMLVHTHINTLDLRKNSLGAEGAAYIRDLLMSNHVCANAHLSPISSGMNSEYLLQSLDLRKNELGKDGCMLIASALERVDENNVPVCSLTSLNLDGNNIQCEGATAIANALRVNKRLCWLSLQNNKIGANGCVALAQAIGTNLHAPTQAHTNAQTHAPFSPTAPPAEATGIQFLDITGNKCGDGGATALARTLAGNPYIHTLYIGNNNISQIGINAIAESLRTNNHLLELNIAGNHHHQLFASSSKPTSAMTSASTSIVTSTSGPGSSSYVIANNTPSCDRVFANAFVNNTVNSTGVTSLESLIGIDLSTESVLAILGLPYMSIYTPTPTSSLVNSPNTNMNAGNFGAGASASGSNNNSGANNASAAASFLQGLCSPVLSINSIKKPGNMMKDNTMFAPSAASATAASVGTTTTTEEAGGGGSSVNYAKLSNIEILFALKQQRMMHFIGSPPK
jgi:Ran GTPase-activating protein (RanGAP) involved in mRNA processing and transport